VLFISSGVYRDWNTLTATNAVLIFDRVFRSLLERTLPKRNLTSTERIVVPIPPDLRQAKFNLVDPAGAKRAITPDALGTDRYGLVVSSLPKRGFYRLVASGAEAGASDTKLMNVLLAVNGPAEESELRLLDEEGLRQRMVGAEYRWVAREETIRLASAIAGDQELWKYLLVAVIGCLALEMFVLGWPLARREQSP
jgi:hypothetical protein